MLDRLEETLVVSESTLARHSTRRIALSNALEVAQSLVVLLLLTVTCGKSLTLLVAVGNGAAASSGQLGLGVTAAMVAVGALLCFAVLLLRFGLTIRVVQRAASSSGDNGEVLVQGVLPQPMVVEAGSGRITPVAGATLAMLPGRRAWLRQRAAFLVNRFRDDGLAMAGEASGGWAPWWQLVIWARQLTLLCWARLARSQLEGHVLVAAGHHWPWVWAWAAPAFGVLTLVWRAQRRVRPFAYRSQNQMEAWLLVSSAVLVLLACIYSMLVEMMAPLSADDAAAAAADLLSSNSTYANRMVAMSEGLRQLRLGFDVIVLMVLISSLVVPSVLIVRDCQQYHGEERFVLFADEPSAAPAVATPHEVELAELREQLQRSQLARAIPSKQVLEATSDFAEEQRLGAGGFGAVYVASQIAALPSTSSFAVKRVERLDTGPSALAEHSLLTELHVLGLCRHEHLLPLLGYCLESRHRARHALDSAHRSRLRAHPGMAATHP